MNSLFKRVLPLVVLLSWSASAAEPAFKVVVHPSNPVQTLKREQLAALFLKKTTRWDSGRTVAPVDQGDASAVRQAFSEVVLKKSVRAVESYWQQRIFSGRDVPPVRRATDEEVMAYVQANPEAIGYVSADAPERGVKVVTVSD